MCINILIPALQLSMQRLRGVKLPRVTVEALLCNLSLSLEDIHPTPSTLASVYDSVWRATQCSYRETNPFIEDFIQALVLTKTTGRYASLLCSTKGEAAYSCVCVHCMYVCVRYMYMYV